MSEPTSSPAASRRATLGAASLVFAAALALHAGFAAAFEITPPWVHDEFAYLLSADTFASGRLTNPTHPLWEHFETFHVFQHPTYQAKYPPGQGLFLALGQVTVGEPLAGVWLSQALALAALFWMLAWLMPRRWALLGAGVYLVMHPLFKVWGQSYWGGAVAMLGGALLFGGLVRFRDRLALGDSVAMGAGLLVLANSRPFEGALAALFAAAAYFRWAFAWHHRGKGGALVRRSLVPLLGAALVLGAWTLVYDRALTGDPFRLPYFNYDNGRSLIPEIRAFTGSPEKTMLGKLERFCEFFVGYALLAALPFLVLRRQKDHVRMAALVVGVLATICLVATRAWPHYMAPVVPLMALLLVESLRGLSGVPFGRVAVALLVLVHFAWNLGVAGQRIARGPEQDWSHDRRAMIAELEQQGGKHLVLVQYGPGHDIHKEWVYNGANIDDAPVVWARDLSPEKNDELFAYFSDRTLWTVKLPPLRPILEPYPSR